MITIQYLEPGPHIAAISPSQVQLKLQTAFDHIPIDCLLLGWDIPSVLEEVCRTVTSRAGIKLYRWQPLLTGDGTLYPEIKWRTRNLEMMPIAGFRGLPEFTFICPNNSEARSIILAHTVELAQLGRYDGIFLDRMRYPSPSADPVNLLSCFCEDCHNAALEIGLNLVDVRRSLLDIDEGNLLRVLCGEPHEPLSAFLDFRQQSITQFIAEIAENIRFAGLEIGLDCFSPSLTRMVGQDLGGLVPLAEWTKIMVYGHAFGPASLPFEITNLANWLIERQDLDESDALSLLTEIIKLPLPALLTHLRNTGLPPESLAEEYDRGRQVTDSTNLLVGIELVEIAGVSELNATQIEDDLRAIKTVDSNGLSLSWDLWQIPLERLELVRSVWF